MSEKLEKLNQPVAFDYQIAEACVSDYPNPCGKWVGWRTELSRECPPEWMIEEGKAKDIKLLYSLECVTALLAALEEKDRQIKELEEFSKLALSKIPNEKSLPDFYIVGNGPTYRAYPASMGHEARSDLAGNLQVAYLSTVNWKQRAEAAERREDDLKSMFDVVSAKNAELEQRLQQPIKLPQRKAAYASGYGDGYLVNSDGGDCFDRDDVIEMLQQQGFKVEGEDLE